MGFLSSKTLIKGHALFVFTLAVYLTKSPEVVTESDVVFMLGELLRLDSSTTPSFSRPQSPFAMCGILLAAEALIDLILITKIPHLNEILTMAEAARREAPGAVNGLERMRTNPFIARLTTLYSEIWTLLSLARFCLFFAVSFFIYQSKPDSWKAAADRVVRGSASVSAEPSGLDQLKNRVVFRYGFMEMMFWFWIYITLREERQEVSQRFAERERDQ